MTPPVSAPSYDDGASSPWSSTESIEVAFPPLPPPIPGFPAAAIAIGVVIGLGGTIVLRRRKRSK
ncbi:MAG: Loki-CTERM sorting domain-containing protein [Candidatus Hermodarchaeia archaeon]